MVKSLPNESRQENKRGPAIHLALFFLALTCPIVGFVDGPLIQLVAHPIVPSWKKRQQVALGILTLRPLPLTCRKTLIELDLAGLGYTPRLYRPPHPSSQLYIPTILLYEV